jgi:probable metal-binding protein
MGSGPGGVAGCDATESTQLGVAVTKMRMTAQVMVFMMFGFFLVVWFQLMPTRSLEEPMEGVASSNHGVRVSQLMEVVGERYGRMVTFHTGSTMGMDLDGLLRFLEDRDKVRTTGYWNLNCLAMRKLFRKICLCTRSPTGSDNISIFGSLTAANLIEARAAMESASAYGK